MKQYKIKLTMSDNSTISSTTTIPVPSKISELSGAPVKKYQHNVQIVFDNLTMIVTFSLINDSSTPISNYSGVASSLYNAGFTSGSSVLPATGQWANQGSTTAGTLLIIGVYSTSASGFKIGVKYLKLATTPSNTNTMTISATPNVGTGTVNIGTGSTIYYYDIVREI